MSSQIPSPPPTPRSAGSMLRVSSFISPRRSHQRRTALSPASSPTQPGRPLSPTPSPASSTGPPRTLPFANVAQLFVRMRRAQQTAKAHHITSSSGALPRTHAALAPGPAPSGAASTATVAAPPPRRARLEVRDVFTCVDAVDVAKLLRASRASLLERAALLRANVLVDEAWSCTICGPKHRSDGSFRVSIHYEAFAARSSRQDPHQPVALEEARGVPGLMTILDRQLVSFKTEPYHET